MKRYSALWIILLLSCLGCPPQTIVQGIITFAERFKTFGRGLGVPFPATKIFFATAVDQGQGFGSIATIDLDGTNFKNIVGGSAGNIGFPDGLALDQVYNTIYWTDRRTNELRQASLDGKTVTVLVSKLNAPTGVALDIQNNLVFWLERGAGTLKYADMRDGSNVTQVVAGLSEPEDIALALANRVRKTNGYVTTDEYDAFWTESGAHAVKRGHLVVTVKNNVVATVAVQNPAVIATEGGSDEPRGLAVDETKGQVYWNTQNYLRRANFDGTNRVTIASVFYLNHIALDLTNGKVYYTRKRSDQIVDIDGKVYRMNLDGTGDGTVAGNLPPLLPVALGNPAP